MPTRKVPTYLLALIAAAVISSPAFAGEYTIQPGDTLWSLAGKYGLTVAALCAANGLSDADKIEAGHVLVIPEKSEGRPGFIIADRVNLRRSAGTDGEIIACLDRGTALSIMESCQGWDRVELHDGRKGWVASQFTGSRQVDTASRSSRVPDQVIAAARRLLGVRYVWGGTTTAGFDCSGYVQAVFKSVGIDLPRRSYEQFAAGKPVNEKDMEPGDVLFFTTYAPGASHSAIYLGGESFIHASSAGGGVIVTSFSPYYRSRFLGARRFR